MEGHAMTRVLKVIALAALLTAVQAEAGSIAYEYVTGPVSQSSQGAPVFEPGTTVSGTFKYDPGAILHGPGAVPGTLLYPGALSELLGSVQGFAFSDPSGVAVVGDEQTGTPPGTSGADLLSLVPDLRGSCAPCDFEGFVLGDYRLVNVRLFWLEGQAGAPDFLTSSDLPTALPEFPGRLALDFIPTTGVGPTLFVFFENLLVRPVSVPDPGTLLQQLGAEVEGVGPGRSLTAKVANAQTYYAVPDVPATCAVLTGFVHEVDAQRGKHVALDLASALTADAQVIMTAIGCN
jgi:hypothetical protein